MTRKNWEKCLFEQLPHLLRYAKALTRNNDLAEDLVQDCLERAWVKKLMWNSQRRIRPWLFTIMHNLYVNQIKKQTISTTSVENYDSIDTLLTVTADNRNLDNSSLLRLRDLESALGKLSPEYREIILLAGLENLTYKEISKVTALPLGTVMSRLSRAREKLRTLMEGDDSNKVVRLR